MFYSFLTDGQWTDAVHCLDKTILSNFTGLRVITTPQINGAIVLFIAGHTVEVACPWLTAATPPLGGGGAGARR